MKRLLNLILMIAVILYMLPLTAAGCQPHPAPAPVPAPSPAPTPTPTPEPPPTPARIPTPETTPAPETKPEPAPPPPAPASMEAELKYDSGRARGLFTLAPSFGYLIDFMPPTTPFTIEKVKIFGALLGTSWEGKDFTVAIWDKDGRLLQSESYPVTEFMVGAPGWAVLAVPDVQVTDKFYVHVFTGTGRNGGIHIGVDDSVVNEHSGTTIKKSGLYYINTEWPFKIGSWIDDKSKANWMIRAAGSGTAPTSQQSLCPPGSPPDKMVYYTFPERPWPFIPDVTISARAGDPRIQMAHEAIEWWNQQLADIGTPFRLGPVTHITEPVPVDYLIERSSALLEGKPIPALPESVKQMPGDLIIALSDGMFVSFCSRPSTSFCLIGIRNCETKPLSLKNVARNVIAHELGHATSLGHNNDPTKLMCGRPAECRPSDFHCDVEQFFSVTEEEKAHLLKLYPPNWKPVR